MMKFGHGGPRKAGPGKKTGTPKRGTKRVKVSPTLALGSKELAQGITEVFKLAGWGYAIDEALIKWVEGDAELRGKLAEMGIILKSKSYLPNKSKEY